MLSDFGPEVRPAVHDGEEWWCFVMALSIAGDRYDVLGKVGMPVGLHLRQKRGAIQAMRNDLDRARAVNDYGKVARLAERLEREQVALAAVEGGTLL
ncbi:hypothetical protein J4558_23660 [Leptolyngbya sp. 15MV]|nr:hypothetical protein J4558_23660 [Leptolyngbya sp. 15MV]